MRSDHVNAPAAPCPWCTRAKLGVLAQDRAAGPVSVCLLCLPCPVNFTPSPSPAHLTRPSTVLGFTHVWSLWGLNPHYVLHIGGCKNQWYSTLVVHASINWLVASGFLHLVHWPGPGLPASGVPCAQGWAAGLVLPTAGSEPNGLLGVQSLRDEMASLGL